MRYIIELKTPHATFYMGKHGPIKSKPSAIRYHTYTRAHEALTGYKMVVGADDWMHSASIRKVNS